MPGGKSALWLEYEKLAEKIIAELSPHAVVTHNERVLGQESEVRRQIDVTVRWTDGVAERLMIVQVKDYGKRRADVNVVGEFRSVIQDVGADRGILICSGGFSKTAKTYARNLKIDLYSLADAASKRWELELSVTTLWRKILPTMSMSARFRVVEAPFTISADGETGTVELFVSSSSAPYDLQGAFKAAWDAGQLSFEEGAIAQFPVDQVLSIKGTDSTGVEHFVELADLQVSYRVEWQHYVGQLRPAEYRGLIDHLNAEGFLPSYLAVDFPPLTSTVWEPVDDPERLAVLRPGFFVTAEDARIETSKWDTPVFTHVSD
ncbi:restriction endonuclease [Lentzea sp. NBC_00516]|uniref:restriction endonuclease n=1 Tax=Lentzea sp. NBC_00516 TaxID=2903582 RepID=UPI002E811105|nr:restriction endonuclease [Lentzea sp. NBC_00516]WUD23784.1 restriction endonuclease [Lentzea sp. NBC_00516]